MAEGGRYPWKIQKIWERGPVGNYNNIRDPLPRPPKDMVWSQDPKTREFTLVRKCEEEERQNHAQAQEPSVVITDLPGQQQQEQPEEKHEQEEKEESGSTEWELLSDRVSLAGGTKKSSHNQRNGSNNGVVLVAGNGSVKSIGSFSESATNKNVPASSSDCGSNSFRQIMMEKMHKTPSSSTINSEGSHSWLGPSGKGILGVDYVEHVVLPTDTFQGICLAYKVQATRLRQANHFSGNNLLLAPKKLVIPLSKKALRTGYIRVQDTDSKEYKIHAFQSEFSYLSFTEAKAYLELADWVLEDAKQVAREDSDWEKQQEEINDAAQDEMNGKGKNRGNQNSPVEETLKSGEIRITLTSGQSSGLGRRLQQFGFKTRGAGIFQKSSSVANNATATNRLPTAAASTIGAKSVRVDEAYQVANQHGGMCGVEMQPIAKKKESVREPTFSSTSTASTVDNDDDNNNNKD